MKITSAMADGLIYTYYTKEPYYRTYEILEKNGKIRKIDEPCDALKLIQQELNRYFYRFPTHKSLKAYIENCEGAKETALTHQFTVWGAKPGDRQSKPPRWLLKMDLKDFFPSIKTRTVENVLFLNFLRDKDNQQLLIRLSEKLNKKFGLLFKQFIELLIWLTAGNGCLTQGAPTSPYLANLVWTESGVIEKILDYLHSRKKEFNLAIYADDISVSFLERKYPRGVIKNIAKIINDSEYFKINPKKTKLNRLKHGAHLVVGISIGKTSHFEPSFGIPQKFINTLRGELHKTITIIKTETRPIEQIHEVSIPMMRGKIGWVKSVYGDRRLPSKIKKLVEEFEILSRII
ncbi:MAG: RNA-directed DNA polymerase [uncultured bacterium]|nr:MAG: RNA-directed DNA polymerase [uncultured bacterium]